MGSNSSLILDGILPCFARKSGRFPLAVIIRPNFHGIETWRESIFSKKNIFTNVTVTSVSNGEVIKGENTLLRSGLILKGREAPDPCSEVSGYIIKRAAEIFPLLGIFRFQPSHIQVSVTSYGSGDHFAKHYDDLKCGEQKRVVSFVYFLHAEPRKFLGGELQLFEGADPEVIEDRSCTVPPDGGTLVVFRSNTLHEVCPVHTTSLSFEDRRLTITGFLSRKRTPWENLTHLVLPVFRRIRPSKLIRCVRTITSGQ